MPRQRGRATPRDADWMRHKSLIRKRYIIDAVSLASLSKELEELGFSATPKQLEHQLARWGLRRKLTEAGWQFVNHTLTQREAEGKESVVLLCGRQLNPSTVSKERSRHQIVSLLPRIDELPPSTPSDLPLSVCTPPSIPLDFAWSPNLPWLSFERRFSTIFVSGFSKSLGSKSLTLAVGFLDGLAREDANVIASNQSLPSDKHAITSIARFASILGRYIPESYSGEHLNRAEIIRRGTIEEVCQECAKVLLFRMSNSLDDILSCSQWKFIIDLLHGSPLLKTPLDLTSLTQPSIGGFIESLFRNAVFYYVASRRPSDDKHLRTKSWDVLEWLTSSGFDFNHILVPDPDSHYWPRPALDLALRHFEYKLAVLLIHSSTNLNPSERVSPLIVLLESIVYEEIERGRWERQPAIEMLELMLKLGILSILKNPSGSNALAPAISIGDIGLIDILVRHGANPLGTFWWDDDRMFLEEDDALSLCARHIDPDIALSLSSYMLGILERLFPASQIPRHVTVRAIVAASAEGYVGVMELLLRRTGVPLPEVVTHEGATPLHAASYGGHLELCQLLLQWGHSADTVSLYGLSPLHLACIGGHPSIVRLLAQHGADPERAFVPHDSKYGERSTRQTRKCFWLPSITDYSVTPLFFALARTYGGWMDCAIALLEAGVCPHSDALLAGVECDDGRLFDLLLDGGADPNAKQIQTGRTVLQCALEVNNHRYDNFGRPQEPIPNVEVERRVKALLTHGVKLTGGEALLAIRLGSLDLVERLIASGASGFDSGRYYGEQAMEIALQSKHTECPRLFDVFSPKYLNGYDAGMLCAATRAALVLQRNRDWVEIILRRRPLCANPDPMEGTALALAMRHEDRGMMELLLEYIPTPDCAILPFNRFWPDQTSGWKVYWVDWNSRFNDWDKTSFFWRIKARGVLLGRGLVVDRVALATAAAYGSLPLVKLLVARLKQTPQQIAQHKNMAYGAEGHSPNPIMYDNPFYWALSSNNGEIIRLVREVVDTRSGDYGRFSFCRSNLQKAVELGMLEIVKDLIDAGMDVNEPPATYGGATSLQLAAIQGYLGIAKCLVDLGADINAAGAEEEGRTSLEGAAEYGKIDMIQFLLNEGAETTGKGQRQYLQAVKFAELRGHAAAANMLRDHRAWNEEDRKIFASWEGKTTWEVRRKPGLAREEGRGEDAELDGNGGPKREGNDEEGSLFGVGDADCPFAEEGGGVLETESPNDIDLNEGKGLDRGCEDVDGRGPVEADTSYSPWWAAEDIDMDSFMNFDEC